jgi:hypothetical protein
MAMKPKAKPKAKPKTNVSKDYMKPVGGTKQEVYKAPGSVLNWNDQKSGTQRNWRAKTGESASKKMSILGALTAEGITAGTKYLKTGINPTAMKATAGNPKPTKAQVETAKKKAATKAKNKTMETQAQKKKNTKPAKGSTKGSGINSKPASKPTTGVYKRGNP